MLKTIFILFLLIFSGSFFVSAQQTGINRSVFSPDGKLLATVDYSGEVSVWDLASNKERSAFSLKNRNTKLFDFTADGKTLVLNDSDKKQILFFDVNTGKETKRLGYNNFGSFYGSDTSVLSADGQTMWMIAGYNGGDAPGVWLIDLKNNSFKEDKPNLCYDWTANSTRTTLACYSPDDKKIILFSANSGKEIKRLPVDARFVKDEKKLEMLITGSADKIILRRSYEEKSKENEYERNNFYEIAAVSAADGKELKTGIVPFFKEEDEVFDGYSSFELSRDSSKLFLSEISDYSNGDKNHEHLTTIDAGTLQKISANFYPGEIYDWSILNLDGSKILTADGTGKIKIWDAASLKQTGSLFPSQSPFQQIAVSPDDTKFAAIAKNGTIKIWNADGTELLKISTELPEGILLAFSPNGQNLLSVHLTTKSKQSFIDEPENLVHFKLWNAANGKLVREFDDSFYNGKTPHDFIVFTKQGDRFISDCGSDKDAIDLCVWNVNTGEFSGRSFPINKDDAVSIFKINDAQPLSFNQHGSKKLTANDGYEKDLLVWDFSGENLLKQTTDADEASKAFGENQTATAILINSYETDGRHHWILKLDGKSNLKTSMERLALDFAAPDQTFGAKFIDAAAVKEKEEKSPLPPASGSIGTIPSSPFPTNNSDAPTVNEVEADLLDNFAEIYNFDQTDFDVILKGHTDDLIDLAFIGGGKRVITTSYDRTVRVWDTAAGKQLTLLR